ncbi:MAG: L-histidine N(alpha)-methyltransferase [Alphaproteobacteria bacterium]|nr:L-histidine N(alpha)-methyltransferase [Alphaproteobacteria bacterium]|tara:strand:+ start:62 stop:1021 length:960 start_codon:yes stop_codon:yes gene_type:complete
MKIGDENEPDLSARTFLNDVLIGLSHQSKYLPAKWFYDHTGAKLFEKICDVPEYYLTRTEREILETAAPDIARELGSSAVLIEYGSGTMTKVRLVLDAIDKPYAFVAVDIVSGQLEQAAADLEAAYPELRVQTIATDFTNDFSLPDWLHSAGRCCVFFPGSTIGNFEPGEIKEFLQRLHRTVDENGALLIGVDLKKDRKRLEAAYNDSLGLTALFNKNILRRINHELDGDICINSFQHLAWYNPSKGRVEMHLRSCLDQNLNIAGQEFHFRAGETIHTENCYKFTVPEFQSIAMDSGFRPVQVWTDKDNLFSIHLFDAN